MIAGDCDKATRKWRRSPASVKNDELLFCAGNIDTLKEIGGRLYDSLFRFDFEGKSKDLTDAFLTARAGAPDAGEGLGLAIDLSEAPELSRVPWEALFLADDHEELLLGIDTRTNIVRRLESYSDGGLPPAAELPIRMLVAVANPEGELAAGTEIGNIERRLGSLPRDNERYAVATLERATRAELHRRIVNWKPHIIHFIGHGGFDDDKGVIYLHSGKDSGARDAVDSKTLRNLVHNDPPWLVVLNSCLSGASSGADPFAGAAQNLIRANVPFVVAMQAPISDEAAIRFSEDFYSALAADDTVATAVTRGRAGILALEDEGAQPELITPVLYSNGRAERISILELAPPKPNPSSPAAAKPGSVWSAIWADVRKSGITQITIGVIAIGVAIWLGSPAANDDVASYRSARRDVPGRPLDSVVGAPSNYEGWNPPVSAAPPAPRGPRLAPVSGSNRQARPRREMEVAATGPVPRNSYASAPARAAQSSNAMRSPVPIEPLPPPEQSRNPAMDAFTGASIGLIPPSGPGAAPRPPRPSPAPTPAPPPDAGDRERALRALVGQSGDRRLMGGLSSMRRSTARAEAASRRAATQAEAQERRDERLAAREQRYAEILAHAAESGDYVVMVPPDFAIAPPPPSINLARAADFAAASSVPISLGIRPYVDILSSQAGERMTIELAGGVDPGELAALATSSAAADQLASARAESVAAALRDRGIATERIAAASGADWQEIPGTLPPGRSSVEARLVLPDANRIRFARGSAEPGPDGMATLDRLASFARESPQFLLLLEGHSDESEPDALGVDRRRAARVAEELGRRGVDAFRILTRSYSHSRRELFGSRGPERVRSEGLDADRRVQIVILPVTIPVTAPPSAPPPDLPTPP